MNLGIKYVLIVVLLLNLLSEVGKATLSKKDKKKRKEHDKNDDKKTSSINLPSKTVIERGLVSESVKWKEIVSSNQLYSSAHKTSRRLSDDTLALGYVTPWNNHGYDTAKWFAKKFTHISPVWLQIRVQGSEFSLTGTHDIDQGWVKDVRSSGKGVKIVPRVLFEGWNPNDFQELFASQSRRTELAQFLRDNMSKHQFDGAVLELWSQFGGQYKSDLIKVVKEIGKQFHSQRMDVILVIPPQKGEESPMFGSQELDKLAPFVDAFSLMTYDYSSHASPGPVAPLHWVQECVQSLAPDNSPLRSKILVGLNFYGYDFGASSMEAVVGSKYIEILSQHKPKLKWDDHCQEHHFSYKSLGGTTQRVYFPTLKSLQDRLSLVQDIGTGVAVWELGQGLDYFFDLF